MEQVGYESDEAKAHRALARGWFTRDHDKITMELCGIGIVRNDARRNLERIERLIKQVADAMKSCK